MRDTLNAMTAEPSKPNSVDDVAFCLSKQVEQLSKLRQHDPARSDNLEPGAAYPPMRMHHDSGSLENDLNTIEGHLGECRSIWKALQSQATHRDRRTVSELLRQVDRLMTAMGRQTESNGQHERTNPAVHQFDNAPRRQAGFEQGGKDTGPARED